MLGASRVGQGLAPPWYKKLAHILENATALETVAEAEEERGGDFIHTFTGDT